jgi:hypothetical protein
MDSVRTIGVCDRPGREDRACHDFVARGTVDGMDLDERPTSPTERFCRWFEALAPEIAEEFAVELLGLFPGGLLRSSLVISRHSDGLTARIRRLNGDFRADVGMALALIALTDFIFSRRASGQDWEKNDDLLTLLDTMNQEVMLDGPDAEKIDAFVEQTRLRQPLRARQWQKAYASWRPLREGPLDPASFRHLGGL